MKISCPRCRIGWIGRDICSQCGYRIKSWEERQERMGRVIRNSLIGLVSVIAGVWISRLF
jgi:hypothetical protein